MIKKRSIISQIEHKLVHTKNIIIILGARQTGKTSIMKYVHEKYSAQFNHNVLYLDLEDELLLANFSRLANSEYPQFLKNKGLDLTKEGLVFFDEIQYLDQPTKVLKYLHDTHRHIRVIVSGSSSLHLKKKVKETLTGRKSVFHLTTLSWQEFLEFSEKPGLAARVKEITLKKVLEGSVTEKDAIGIENDIYPLWHEFLLYGGYPKVVLTENLRDKRDELEEIYNTYIKKDVKDLAAVKGVSKFTKLVELLSWQVGNIMVANELSDAADTNIATINSYLDLLEETYVIERIKPFYSNKRLELIKSPKVYFLDTGLRNTAARSFSDVDKRSDRGALVENFVFSELVKKGGTHELKYWRKKNSGLEVDFIEEYNVAQDVVPIEVKWTMYDKPRVPRSIRSFVREYPVSQAVVINKNLFAKEHISNTEVWFVPLWITLSE